MLNWFRARRLVDEAYPAVMRPFMVLQTREPGCFPGLWGSPYCCTAAYIWTAVISDDHCDLDVSDDVRVRALREIFSRVVRKTGGSPHDAMRRILPDGHPLRRRALTDLKRVVDLYKGHIDDRYMIYAEYRTAVYEDGRPALPKNRWGLDKEFAYEILFSACMIANASPGETGRAAALPVGPAELNRTH